MKCLTHKVRNQETNNEISTRKTGTGQDSNLERSDERPTPFLNINPFPNTNIPHGQLSSA